MMHQSAIIDFQLRSAIIDRPLAFDPHTTALEAIERMNESDQLAKLESDLALPKTNSVPSGCAFVVENERLVGILTDRDLLRALGARGLSPDLTIGEIMTQPAIVLPQERFTDLTVAIDLLYQHQIRYLPLVDRLHRPIGLLTRESLQPRVRTNELWLEHVSTLECELAQTQSRLTQLEQENQSLSTGQENILRTNQLKDEFLANMSHELRTPLNAILGMAEGLEEGIFGPPTAAQIQAIKTIEDSSNHLLALIDDILDLAKIGAGQIELDCAPTDIGELCYVSVSFIKHKAIEKKICLQLQLPQQIPSISIDERRMRQVLINLIDNAVKFTPIGGNIVLSVSIRADNSNRSFLRLSVNDNGIGINSADLHQLFEPFVQVNSALNRQYNGAGLGLAIVKGIVELHGGSVRAESELGAGSHFSIDLPIVGAIEIGNLLLPTVKDLPPIAERVEKLNQEVTDGRGWKILLAEDNDANIYSISSFLRAKGYQTILAKNGLEAINLAQSELPDLILMDIQMPKMDGLAAIRHLRAQPQTAKVPIIAITALAMSGDREKCLSAGADEYLAKPIKLKQLSSIVHQFLNRDKIAAT